MRYKVSFEIDSEDTGDAIKAWDWTTILSDADSGGDEVDFSTLTVYKYRGWKKI